MQVKFKIKHSKEAHLIKELANIQFMLWWHQVKDNFFDVIIGQTKRKILHNKQRIGTNIKIILFVKS